MTVKRNGHNIDEFVSDLNNMYGVSINSAAVRGVAGLGDKVTQITTEQIDNNFDLDSNGRIDFQEASIMASLQEFNPTDQFIDPIIEQPQTRQLSPSPPPSFPFPLPPISGGVDPVEISSGIVSKILENLFSFLPGLGLGGSRSDASFSSSMMPMMMMMMAGMTQNRNASVEMPTDDNMFRNALVPQQPALPFQLF